MSFEIIPSIDVLGGRVVRLERGDYDRATVFSDDPVAVAAGFQEQGASRLHVVDLDAARDGEPANREVIRSVVEAVTMPVQVAGGVRDIEAAQTWLSAGATRVVVGTKALTDESFLERAVDELGDRFVVAADARDGQVRVAGWLQGTGEDVVDAARRLAAAGVARLLVTDIATDGMLSGPNVRLFEDVAAASGVPVVASGGISGLDDVRALARIRGVEGAIVGRALYVGALDLAEAVRSLRGAEVRRS